MKLKKFSYKVVNSTNDVAIRKIKKGFSSGIIVSDVQKKGRGQYGKKWISIKGNLFLSIFFKVNLKMSLIKFTKKNCLLIKKILSRHLKQKITIKLPNDLLVNKEKLCGVLQETLISNNNRFVIVGIGLNILKNPSIKGYPTTCLFKLTGKKNNKFNILNNIKNNYEKNFKYLCT